MYPLIFLLQLYVFNLDPRILLKNRTETRWKYISIVHYNEQLWTLISKSSGFLFCIAIFTMEESETLLVFLPID